VEVRRCSVLSRGVVCSVSSFRVVDAVLLLLLLLVVLLVVLLLLLL
jgi:hypothetical protein